MAVNWWARSIVSDGDVQRLKAKGSFPLDLAYQIPLSMERFRRCSPVSAYFTLISSVEGLVSPAPVHAGITFLFWLPAPYLNPTSILHITNFITFCKCFLRTAPHFNLFC